jgi:hypothetical protein
MTIQAWILGQSIEQRQAQQGFYTQGLVATGNSQGTALACPTDCCVFATVAASTGCQVLGADDTAATPGPCHIGDTMVIVNHGASTLSVYPQSGGKIANGAANAAFSVAANKTAFLVYLGSNLWAGSVSA